MSLEAQVWAWEQDVKSATDLLVLLAICNGVNDQHGYTYGSVRHFAAKTGLSERSVQRAIVSLTDVGFITVEERRGRTSLIRPVFTPVTLFADTPDTVSPPPGRRSPPPTQCHPTPDTVSPNPEEEPIPSEPKGSSGYPPQSFAKLFDGFWAMYPRKVGRRDAEAAHKRALIRLCTHHRDPTWTQPRNQAAGLIIAGLEAQLPAFAADDPSFIPHPATWLNRDGWLDEITPRGPTNGHAPNSRAAERRANLERASTAAEQVARFFDG